MFLKVKGGKFNRPVQGRGSTCRFGARSEGGQRVRSINRIASQCSHRYSRGGHDTIVLHFSSITYSLVSSFHFSDWSIGFVVVADWLIGFEGIGFAVKVVFAGIGFAVKVVFAGIGFAVKVVFAGIGFAVKSVFGGIGFAVKSVFGVKCVFCTINDRERKNVFFWFIQQRWV